MNIPCEQVGPTTVLPEHQCGSSEVIVGENETKQNKPCFWKAVVCIDE